MIIVSPLTAAQSGNGYIGLTPVQARMDRRPRLTVPSLAVVSVLSGFVILYNHGMATWEGRSQPLYRSVEVVVQTVTTVGDGGDAPWSSP